MNQFRFECGAFSIDILLMHEVNQAFIEVLSLEILSEFFIDWKKFSNDIKSFSSECE